MIKILKLVFKSLINFRISLLSISSTYLKWRKAKSLSFTTAATTTAAAVTAATTTTTTTRKQFCGKKVLHLVFDVHKKAE